MYDRKYFVAALLIICSWASIGWAEPHDVIAKKDFRPDADGMPGEKRYDHVIDLGHGLKLPAVVEVTARGNGCLAIANLKDIKVWNEGAQGPFYSDTLLHVEFIDITGDGYKDLVITGTMVDPGEKGDGPCSFFTTTAIYVFDSTRKEFRLVFQNGPSLEP